MSGNATFTMTHVFNMHNNNLFSLFYYVTAIFIIHCFVTFIPLFNTEFA